MRIIIGLGHPAHFHLFKGLISYFSVSNDVRVIVSSKDILIPLLEESGFSFEIINHKNPKDSLFKKIYKLLAATKRLNVICKLYKPDLLIGCNTELGFVSFLNRIPSLFFAEDDFSYTFLQGLLVYPFVTHIISPETTNVGPFKYKKVSYKGYQKLSYLDPRHFIADKTRIHNKISSPFFLLRLVSLQAYHDIGKTGINNDQLGELIELLNSKGQVLISSEGDINPEYDKYILKINPIDIHHYLANATLLISDSQSMTVEAAMLGTPSIRYNNFVGRINILNELEEKYKLTFGVKTGNPKQLIEITKTLLGSKDIHQAFLNRQKTLLRDHIDVLSFFIWMIENYPESIRKLKINPNLQDKFK